MGAEKWLWAPALLNGISKITLKVVVFHRRLRSHLFYTSQVIPQCRTRVKFNRVFFPCGLFQARSQVYTAILPVYTAIYILQFYQVYTAIPGIYLVYTRPCPPAAHFLARFVSQALLAASDLDVLRIR